MLKYLDYTSQGAYRDDEQEVNRKPNYILNLSGEKHLVIDSKISFNAYINYFNCDDPNGKKGCLKQLTKSINDHIDQLAAKNYHTLTGLKSADFVCTFMWVEPALSLAINEKPDIIRKAMSKHIIILTPTTLMQSPLATTR